MAVYHFLKSWPRKLCYATGMIFMSVSLFAQTAPTDTTPKKPFKPGKGRSSIVDDSTKNVYGPKTTMYTTEKSLFYNKNVYVPIDTSFLNLHKWTYVQRSNNFYKDLGNMGTALSPIFPTLSSTIGVTSGFTAYAPYYETEEPKYFNTKSPFTQLYIIWGGNGRAITKVEFSRNINPRWNFGLNYRPIWVDRQIQRQKSSRQTVSQYYDFYTTYKGKDDRYLLLMNYRRIRHRVFESDGVNLPAGSPYAKMFDPNAALNISSNFYNSPTGAATEEYRTGAHLLQQYQIAKPFQIYSITDIHTQVNKFTYKSGVTSIASLPASVFDYSQGDSLNNDDRSTLKTIVEEAGIKGNAGPLFYDYYFKLRSYQYNEVYQDGGSSVLAYTKSGLEKYVGGRMALRFDSLTELSGNAEYLLDGHYKIEGNWQSKWLDASIKSTLSRPGFMQNIYQGSHNAWINNFTNVGAQQLTGFIKAQLGPLQISPGATFTTLHNYIYFKQVTDATLFQQVLPYQSDFQILFAPELRMSITLFKKLSFKTQAIYSSLAKNDGDALQIPQVFFNGQMSYESPFFKGNLHVQVGVEAHWHSSYYATGYATPIQSFYVQKTTVSPSFLMADIFLNAKIKRGRFFFKYQNLVQAFTKIGYMPTPGYPGTQNLLDFGFIMVLFD